MNHKTFFEGLGRTNKTSKVNNKKNTEYGHEEESPAKQRRNYPSKEVDSLEHTVKLIRAFLNMNNKKKELYLLSRFIRRLQKLIAERQITRRSPHAKEIELVQKLAIKAHETARGNSVTVNIEPYVFEQLYKVSRSEKVRPSVGFLKRFVALLGKPFNRELKEKMQALNENLELMVSRKMINRDDPYVERVRAARNALTKAINSSQAIAIPQTELNGLNGIISSESGYNSFFEYGGELLAGTPDQSAALDMEQDSTSPLPAVMTAVEQDKRHIEGLHFTGYFKKLIGEPEPNFFMMVYGLAFNGKSSFLLLFAKYLAENFGQVLYVWPEQYGSLSAKLLAERLGVNHCPGITFCSDMKNVPDFEPFKFIVLDSATDAGYSLEDVQMIRERFPNKAIIAVLQSTKTGGFRGEQKWAHKPCVKIRIADKTAYVEKNRFIQEQPEPMPVPVVKEKTGEPTEPIEGLYGLKKKIVVSDPEAIPEIKLQFFPKNHKPEISFTTSKDCADFARTLFAEGEIGLQEQLIVLYINRKHKLIGYYKHTRGTSFNTLVDIRMILAAAMKSISHAIILVHNHPTGGTRPSENDIRLTRKVREAATLMDVTLLDHIIISTESFFSFADDGIL